MKRSLSFLFSLLGFGADVVTVTSGVAGNAGSTNAEMITYMSAKALEVAVTNTVLDQFGDKQPLPAGASKTIRFTRLEKFSVAATPSQLTEGLPPDATGVTINYVEATAEQYGFLARISEVAELTARHPIVQLTLNRMGLNAAETYDQLIFNVLNAATNVYRPNNRAGDTNLVATDLIGYVDLVTLLALLQDQAAMPVRGQNYVLVVPPQVNAGLLKDTDFKASNQFKSPEKIWNGQAGTLANFDIVVSNAPSFAATSQATVGAANKVFSSFAIGREAYQISDLQSLQVFVTPPGGHSDALHQNYLMGFKFMMKSLISNQNWIRLVRSAGAISVNN
jgi:N4-gp56 family major capsid protein